MKAPRHLLIGLSIILLLCVPVIAEPRPEAVAAFNSYVSTVESRLARQHRSHDTFLAAGTSTGQQNARLRRGELIIEQLNPPADPPGALLRHWRGTAFAPGAKAADFEHLLRQFDAYPQFFAPQVLRARILSQQGDQLRGVMRVRQKHIITVVMDTTYDVSFGRRDPLAGYSTSRSIHIDEIDSPGTSHERVLGDKDEHGFLWRLNTYWTYEERDGGLYLQIESVSLSRSIPAGLGWAVRPFVESVPRESLEFTLRSAAKAISR